MLKPLKTLLIVLFLLVGWNVSARLQGEEGGCDTYARRTSRQSDVAVFVPERDTLIIGNAVECVGTPELYRADISPGPHGAVKTIELWYPTDGIIMIGIEWPDSPSRAEVHEFRQVYLNRIYYVPPNSEPVSIVGRVYRAYEPTIQQERIRMLQPWDGWENIKIIYELNEAS